jgi:uncharacterized protein YgiM (DUF1202 family)
MKKLLCASLLCFVVAGFAAAQIKGSTMYVSAKTLALKSSTGFFAKTKGSLGYGDQVTVLQVSGKWVEVRSASNNSLSGWASASSLTTKRVIAGSAGNASAKEIALAGKGFNQEVENAYKAKGQLNYADVDRAEAITVSEDDLQKFLVEGRLKMGE